MRVRGVTKRQVLRGLTSLIVAVAVSSSLVVGTVLVQNFLSRAQTPNPSYLFANVTPPSTTIPSGSSGIVVEGTHPLCYGAPSVPEIQYLTKYWLEAGWDIWTEISIYRDAVCDTTIAEYQYILYLIIHYVQDPANVDPAYAQNWLGVMVDEETGYGFSVSQINSLNDWLAAELYGYVSLPTWWSTEVFSGQGDWSQAEYNSIVSGSYPAPQIATNYMVQLANSYYASYGQNTLVTWSAVYPAPYNSGYYAVNAVNGPPYAVSHGKVTYYFSNKFCPGSCL